MNGSPVWGSASDRADEVRLARAYLCTVAEPPAPALAAFVDEHGPVAAAARVRRGEVPKRVASETDARRGRDVAEAHLRTARTIGARLLTPEDRDWPVAPFASFAICEHEHLHAPLALWTLGPGRLAELAERSVAIVGSRAATGYGTWAANWMAHGVAELGFTVVSGAAYGIDGAAHRGALAAEGPTVAVLACGVDRIYPAGHERLLRYIASTGLVVSEYPPGAVPARHRFLVRNRLIAGLAAGTVVVEAAWRSGARRTASDASLLGRPVMAVPGPVTSALSAGCHRLLREPGTVAVTRAEEVIEEVGRIGIDLAVSPAPAIQMRATDVLSGPTLRVHESLAERALDLRELSVDSGLPIELVRTALRELERRGMAERVERGWCRRRGLVAGGWRGDA
ncbi:DNA-processing protein DprA [Pseudonocardia acaciae]|uniref:DNA-processing protein DprA n=1 Tax=Pseudonocardia acaciae TaxID=551276 RepID=UPI00068817AB|nr:DNA-processing protein DprA [Pseudonocardia acaciae]